MKPPAWSDEHVYFDPGPYFQDLFRAIDQARVTIDLESYIFELDPVGYEMIERLKGASGRGVKVRVILDGVGSWLTHEAIAEAWKNTRIELKIYHPFSFLGLAFSQVNKRLHRKVIQIDRKIVFTGSFNITAKPNRDTGVRLAGGDQESFAQAFERIWSTRFKTFGRAGRTRRSRRVPLRVRLNETKRLRRICNHDLSRRILSAKKRVWVTNAYFVPPFFLLRALCHAGLSGVDVRLILPERSDHLFMKWVALAFYRTLLLSGVRILEFQKTFLHAKTWIIDDWVMVGSTNLNYRSLVHDLEVDVVLGSEHSRIALEEQFETDSFDAVELDPMTFRLGWFSRFLQWVVLRFRFFM